jgi:hypothetical protein
MSPARSEIVELRNYTMVPGTRDRFVELYEREFVESQEAVGIDLIGTFRNAGDPDRFVWLRGFPDSEKRARSLDAFYTSDLWKAHRNAANACIADSDDVLLLKPAWNGSGFAYRPRVPTAANASGCVVATICHFDAPVGEAFVAGVREMKHDGTMVAAMVTEPGPNSYPRLPVREGENVFAWFALFPDRKPARGISVPTRFQRLFAKPPEVLRLLPTPRSRLHA